MNEPLKEPTTESEPQKEVKYVFYSLGVVAVLSAILPYIIKRSEHALDTILLALWFPVLIYLLWRIWSVKDN